MFLASQIVGFNRKDNKLAKNHIFFIFGFDTGWKPAYKPQTRCSSVGEIVWHSQCSISIRIVVAMPEALFEIVSLLWKGFVGGDVIDVVLCKNSPP